jgi:HPt (histidine-containing phosphotransfer) domain-containing protein
MDDFLTKPLRRAAFIAAAAEWAVRGRDNPAEPSGSPKNARSAGLSAAASPVTTASVTFPSPLRYNDFLKEMGGDAVLAGELLDGYITDAARRLEDAERSLLSGDAARLFREVHSIKGGALNLAADETAHCAFSLETVLKEGRTGNTEELGELLRNLREACRRLSRTWDTIRERHETDEGQPGTLQTDPRPGDGGGG